MVNRIFPFLLLMLLGSCIKERYTQFFISNLDLPTLEGPVSFELKDKVSTELEFKNFGLFAENENNELKQIPMQFSPKSGKIWFVNTPGSQSYVLKSNLLNVDTLLRINAHKLKGDLQLRIDKNPMVSYRYGLTYPPKGIDSVFQKSGYVHPLLSPMGDTLSRIQPPDHYHHYGIWGPWTHVQINKKQVDFWNLGDRKGTVLFEKFNEIKSGQIFTSFSARQEHWDFVSETSPQIAINEDLKVTLWNLNRTDRYMLDYESTFSTPLKKEILFEAYRYGGGIGMRFTERWNKDNCTVLTSEGEDRLTADGTKARWCIVKGVSSDGKGTNGILFMSNPKNQAHPEPMRIWPIDANAGRGDMFFEFCPIRYKEWLIAPNKNYELKYRMVIFEGNLSPEEAEQYWQMYAQPSSLTN